MDTTSIAFAARVLLAGLLSAPWSQARAQCPPQWLPGDQAPGVDGSVAASVVWDPDGDGPRPPLLIVGGSFLNAEGMPAAHIAAWDGRTWSALGPGLDGKVTELAVYDGALIAAGEFAHAGGAPAAGIARWDGNTWAGITGVDSSNVQALTVDAGRLYVGGAIVVGGQAGAVGTFDGSEWTLVDTGLANEVILDLRVFNHELFAATRFISGADSVGRVIRFDGSTWQQVGGVMNDNIESLAEYNGRLVAAGAFTASDGASVLRVAEWDGTSWNELGTGVDGAVGRLSVMGGKLVACGLFKKAGGAACANIASWDGASWGPVGAPITGSTFTLCEFNGDLIAGGASIARWDGVHWLRLGRGLDAGISQLSRVGDRLYASGSFTCADGAWLGHIAERTTRGWEPLGDGLGRVYSMRTFGESLIVVAPYDQTDSSQGTFRVWDGSSWSFLSADRFEYVPAALGEWRGQLVAVSASVPNGNNTTWVVRAWDGSAWNDVGPAVKGPAVRALFEWDGDLYVGGWITSAGAAPVANIARWDGAAWSSPGSGLGLVFPDQGVFALGEYGGDLIAAGSFSTAGGAGALRIARWDGGMWHSMGEGLGMLGQTASEIVTDLAVHKGELLASGTFTVSGTATVGPLAAWNGTAWRRFDDAVKTAGAVVSQGADLFLAGSVTPAGSEPTSFWSEFASPIAPSIVREPDPESSCVGATIRLVADATGTGPIQYRWRRNGLPLSDGATAHGSIIWGAGADTLTITEVSPDDSGGYDVIVSNLCGTATSGAAQVSVCPADVNCDSFVSGDDVDLFAVDFELGSDGADVNGDGFVNGDDFDLFAAAFEAGC